MKRILLQLFLSVCLLSLSARNADNADNRTGTLSSRLDTLIKYQLPSGSNVAISVYDLTAGKPLYSYQADKLSRPASTMKLLTT
ncbi:D-alanyl-D-alanine carboxypeptidase, partial [Bacteroides fluxus]